MSFNTVFNNLINLFVIRNIFYNMLSILLIKICFATYVCDVLDEEANVLLFTESSFWRQFLKYFSDCEKSAMLGSIFKAELAKRLSKSLHVRIAV